MVFNKGKKKKLRGEFIISQPTSLALCANSIVTQLRILAAIKKVSAASLDEAIFKLFYFRLGSTNSFPTTKN